MAVCQCCLTLSGTYINREAQTHLHNLSGWKPCLLLHYGLVISVCVCLCVCCGPDGTLTRCLNAMPTLWASMLHGSVFVFSTLFVWRCYAVPTLSLIALNVFYFILLTFYVLFLEIPQLHSHFEFVYPPFITPPGHCPQWQPMVWANTIIDIGKENGERSEEGDWSFVLGLKPLTVY